jgi:hypothetical protein
MRMRRLQSGELAREKGCAVSSISLLRRDSPEATESKCPFLVVEAANFALSAGK